MATEVTEQDVRIRYVVETAKAVAEARKVDKAIADNAKTAKKTSRAITSAQKAQEASSVALTEREKALAAKIKSTREALQAKAKALGLTVTETKKLETETKKLAAAEEAAAKAAKAQAMAKTDVKAAVVAPESKRAVRDLGTSAKRTNDALKETADTAGDVDSALKMVAGAVGLVSPGLARMISNVGDATGGLEGLGKGARLAGLNMEMIAKATPVVAVGIAAVGTAAIVAANEIDESSEAYKRLTANMGDAVAASKRLIASQNALKLASGDVAGFVADLQLQTALLNGEVEEADVRAGELGGELADKLKPKLMAAGQAFAENETKIHAINEALTSGRSLLDKYRKSDEELRAELKAAQADRETLRANLEAIRKLHDEGSDAINAYSKAVDQQRAAEEAAKETTRKSTTSRKEDTAALREAEAAMRAATAAAMGYVAALSSIDDVGTQAARSQLDAYGRLDAQASDRLAQIEAAQRRAVSEAVKAGADGAKAQQAAEEHAAAAREEVWRTYYADLDKLRSADADKAARKAEEITRQQLSQVQQVGGYIDQAVGMVSDSLSDSFEMAADNVSRLQLRMVAGEDFYTDAQKAALQKRIDAQRDAAERQWNAAKQAKVAEAFASTALASINAIAQSPPPSPFGLIGAGIATAAGFQAVAAIESQNPVFDQGGPISAQSDHVPVVAQPGEWMSSKVGRSVLGDDTLRRADAGMAPSREVYAVQVYNHQSVVTKWEADGLAMGNPTDRAIRAASSSGGSIYGHRPR